MIVKMEETIKFNLSSKMAIIKKPESNETYFTYNFPHKIMLLGMLGAIIGLNGYNYYALKKQLGETVNEIPEFYKKLKGLKIAIIPNIKSHNFSRKIQAFNNSVGYASKEDGNNLIVKEQWLEKPSWQIYILENRTKEYKKIKEYLLNKKCEYIPYIGKNDHFANIQNVEILSTERVKNVEYIDSIFKEEILSEEINILDNIISFGNVEKEEYKYKEILPTKLSEKIGYYNFKPFIYTSEKLKIKEKIKLHKVGEKVIYYF